LGAFAGKSGDETVNQELSFPRRIARMVFIGTGVVFVFLSFAPLIFDPATRELLVRHYGSRTEFRELTTGLSASFVTGIALLFGAVLVHKAQRFNSIWLIGLNAIFLYMCWYSSGKELILILPLGASLFCLLIEEFRLLRTPVGLKT
jgi:hypothetical protein